MKRITFCSPGGFGLPGGARRPLRTVAAGGILLAGCALLLGCGSSHAQQPAEQAAPSSAEAVDDTAGADAQAEPVAAPSATRADCSDGTCFPCGDGECPVGAYCDRDGPVGPACAWLSECPGKASCGCIQRVLGASCQCESADGPSVTCDH
jgi:hypothetical protein